MKDAGLDVDESLIVAEDSTYDGGVEAWKELNQIENPPTAYFAGSDELAIGIIHAAQDHGYKSTGRY